MIELLIAFGAGLISFLSPCVLPLIPGYVSFISGQSLQDILKSKKNRYFTSNFILFWVFNSIYYFRRISILFRSNTFTKLGNIKSNSRLCYNNFFPTIDWIDKY